MPTIVTGAAGFVGYHVAARLLERGEDVLGIDSVNDYYDVRLKHGRLALLQARPGFRFAKADLSDREQAEAAFGQMPEATEVVHLAAQAGVRHSMVDPYAYVQANVLGHVAVLEAARRLPKLRHVAYASSSSVYGTSTRLPFREDDPCDSPASVYASTKRANEMTAHAYWHLYGMPLTGLRFFTVYGPWGRPDMAYFGFAEAIMAGRPVTVYDGGLVKRDFTYVDDIVDGVLGCLAKPPEAGSPPPVFNLGNNKAESVATLVALLERSLGRKAVVESVPRPVADVAETWADIDAASRHCAYQPKVPLADGIPRFAEWFLRRRTGAKTDTMDVGA